MKKGYNIPEAGRNARGTNIVNIIPLDPGERVNAMLHEYGEYIIGRMGMPYPARSVNIISVIMDAPETAISNLSGKLGQLQGVSAKVTYSKR